MASFKVAVENTLKNEGEGKYSNDPNDPGGETRWGISKRAFPSVDIVSLSREDAIALYRERYWRFESVDDQMVANKLFDMCVNLGSSTTVRLLQRVLGLVQDGQFGPKSLASVNKVDPQSLLTSLRLEQVIHYAQIISGKPSLVKYVRGWMRRALQ